MLLKILTFSKTLLKITADFNNSGGWLCLLLLVRQSTLRGWSSIRTPSITSLSHTHIHTHTTRPAVHRSVPVMPLSLGSLQASTCAQIHVPTLCSHSIGCRVDGGARHWLNLSASDRSDLRWLDGGPGTHGPAHSCVARECGVWAGLLYYSERV